MFEAFRLRQRLSDGTKIEYYFVNGAVYVIAEKTTTMKDQKAVASILWWLVKGTLNGLTSLFLPTILVDLILNTQYAKDN